MISSFLLSILPSLVLKGIGIFAKTKRDEISGILEGRDVRTRANADVLIAEQEWFWTRIVRPAFGLPLAAYFGFVIAYSMFWCQKCMAPVSWEIAALPGTVGEWAGAIVFAYFAARPVEKVGKYVSGVIAKRYRK